MTDFSFQNRAYDLLQSLKEEKIIHPYFNYSKINSIQELRLMISIIKQIYPLYANADNKTIIEFIKDEFQTLPTEMEVIKANHEFKYRLENKVVHIDDPNSIGIIKGRRTIDNKDQYSIFWSNTSTPSLINIKQWDDEILINLKLEAQPMKTNNIVNYTKDKKYIATVQYERYDPKEWINENIVDGKGKIKELFEPIKDNYDELYKQFDHTRVNFGWIEEEKRFYIGKFKQVLKSIIVDHKISGTNYRNIKIISTELIVPKRQPIISKIKHKEQPKYTYLNNGTDKLVCVKHFSTGVVDRVLQSEANLLVKKDDYGFVNKAEYRKYRTIVSTNKKTNGLTEPKKVKPTPKYTEMGTELILNPKTGEKESIPMVRKDRRSFKHAPIKGSRLVQEQFVTAIIPEKKEEIKVSSIPMFTYENGKKVFTEFEETIREIVRPAYTVIKRIWTNRPYFKEVKITEDIKLQRKERSAIDKSKYYTKKELTPLPELIKEFESYERRNDKFSTVEKWSSIFDKLVVLITSNKLFEQENLVATISKKGTPSVTENIINGEGKLSWNIEKVNSFIRYIRLTTHGVFGEKTIKVKKPIQPVEFEVTKSITRIDSTKLKYNLPEPEKDLMIKFMSKEGEIEHSATFKDNNMYHMITINKGGEGEGLKEEILCSIRDVVSWKYTKDKDYTNLLVDEGGGITQVPIKFRRKDPEHLKKYFERQKQKKNDKKT